MDFNHQLALHALAMMFIWVPFVIAVAVADTLDEHRSPQGRPGRFALPQ